jgi:hypothetical protein
MWFPDIRKRPWRNIDIMAVAVCEILEGFIGLCTIGFYIPTWEMTYLVWRTQKQADVFDQHYKKQESLHDETPQA